MNGKFSGEGLPSDPYSLSSEAMQHYRGIDNPEIDEIDETALLDPVKLAKEMRNPRHRPVPLDETIDLSFIEPSGDVSDR